MCSRSMLMIALLLIASIARAQGNGIAVPPSVAVGGKTQGEWSRLWWQWAASFEPDDSPVADRTGKFCHLKQSGPVWFLAGTYGAHRTIRTCMVPKDTYLFFPLVNYVVGPTGQIRAEECDVCCAQNEAAARSMTDGPSDLVLDLDGQRVEQLETYRQVSPACFDLGALANPRTRVFPSASNGYYVMLKPLSAGKHELNFGGRLPSLFQAVTYTLIVE